MLRRIATMLWGKFESRDEVKKFVLLALIFGLIIGTYWAMRPMKDSIFGAVVGVNWQPWAKILSLCIVSPLVIVYGKLIDTFSRHKVFYILTITYGILALIFMVFFLNPTIGLANTVKDPSRIIGWLWYIYIESYGSLIVALFWAFTTDITSPDSAKRGFPLIAMFGQLGNIVGPYLLKADRWGFANSAPIAGICGILIFLTGLLLWIFMHVIPQQELVGFQGNESEGKEKTGFLEGLRLLLTKRYLLGIFLIISIYEIIVTIIDFQFKSAVWDYFNTEVAVNAYLSNYASFTGIVATLCLLFGINNIQRKLGMTASLILLPALVAVAVLALKFNPGVISVLFWIMVFAKAVNYALNQPTLKQLYIPTTKDTKYKAQAWIEMFGSRGAKAVGSYINTFKKTFIGSYGAAAGVAGFLMLTTITSLGLVAVWFFVALFVSRTYNKAVEEKRVVC